MGKFVSISIFILPILLISYGCSAPNEVPDKYVFAEREEQTRAMIRNAKATVRKAKAYCERGYDYMGSGMYQKAVEAFRQAIKIEPDCAEAHWGLGTCYQSMGDYEEAVEAFKQTRSD